jgi:hypothetical protein
MASKADLFKDLDFLSEKLSDSSRKIAFGILAIWWALLIGDKHPPNLTSQSILGPIALATLSIFADFSQYAISYFYGTRLLRELEKSGSETFQFDRTTILYRARASLFFCKHLFAGAAIAWFVVLIVRAIP